MTCAMSEDANCGLSSGQPVNCSHTYKICHIVFISIVPEPPILFSQYLKTSDRQMKEHAAGRHSRSVKGLDSEGSCQIFLGLCKAEKLESFTSKCSENLLASSSKTAYCKQMLNTETFIMFYLLS